MKKFHIQLFKGHAIINDGDNIILVDTGAPSTIHSSDRFSFCSETFNCTRNYMGLTVSDLSDLLGAPITTLLGADILSKYKILFDYQNQVIGFSNQDIDIDGTQMPLSNFMGIPIIQLAIDKQDRKFFLDTGAKLSYLTNRLTENHRCVGMEEDFYPGYGKFQTECFEIETTVGNDSFVVKYGTLPQLLRMTLMLGGVDGIIGFDFFNQFKVVLDLENKRLIFTK